MAMFSARLDSKTMQGSGLMTRIIEFWKTLTRPTQFIMLGGFVVVLMLAVGIPGALVSAWKDRKFDRQIEQQKKERERETDRANAAEARAVALEAEKLKHELILEVAGERAKVATKRIEDAEKKFITDSDRINGIADICQRYAELRASLNLAPKDCPAAEANSSR